MGFASRGEEKKGRKGRYDYELNYSLGCGAFLRISYLSDARIMKSRREPYGRSSVAARSCHMFQSGLL